MFIKIIFLQFHHKILLRSIITQIPYNALMPFSLQNFIAFSDSEPGCIQTFVIPNALHSLIIFSVILGGTTMSTTSGFSGKSFRHGARALFPSRSSLVTELLCQRQAKRYCDLSSVIPKGFSICYITILVVRIILCLV